MVDNSKIFLLKPKDDAIEKIIVWANNEDEARLIADVTPLKRKEPREEIVNIQNGIYSDSSTLCEDITSQVANIEQFNKSTIHFKYLDHQIDLGAGKAELLKKFFKEE